MTSSIYIDTFRVVLELKIQAKSEKEVCELIWKLLDNDKVACTKITVKSIKEK